MEALEVEPEMTLEFDAEGVQLGVEILQNVLKPLASKVEAS